MLSDRSYMRDNYPRQTTSVVTWLISATVAAFVLQFVFWRWLGAPGLLEHLFGLTATGIKTGKVWTLLTYGFLHDTGNLLGAIFSVLTLYFMGRTLEPVLGPKRLLGVYAGALITGGLLWTAVHWTGAGSNLSLLTGATAGIAGLFMVYACFNPNQPITFLLFFVLPVTLLPRVIILAWLAFDLLGFAFYEVLGAASPIPMAHSAHLGGMAAGWIYYRYLHNAQWRFRRAKPAVQPPAWATKKNAAVATPVYQVNVPSREDLRAEVDRILDKINSKGFAALSADEKRLLDEAKDLLSRR
ncbi:MAG: rhomboid family intramembrane serine protease [Verrucomicrobia bacterium]|nr:rhomboid family intramembrane serine protease [Verrucomicrobiota bacterium]